MYVPLALASSYDKTKYSIQVQDNIQLLDKDEIIILSSLSPSYGSICSC